MVGVNVEGTERTEAANALRAGGERSGGEWCRAACTATFRPDVVLLDLGLPGMDGYAVAESMRRREETPRMKIIAISATGRRKTGSARAKPVSITTS